MENILDDDQVAQLGKHRYTFRTWPVLVWGGLLFLGLIFRFMHYPFSSQLIVLPSAGLTAYSISGLLTLKGKDVLNLVLSILGIAWFIIIILGILYNEGHPYNRRGLTAYSIAFLVVFISCAILKRFRLRRIARLNKEGKA